MTDLRTRNNASSKKSYEKSLEQKYANDYEREMVRHHILTTPDTEAWHWPVVPEEHLYESGYITDFNKHRLERLMRKKDKKEGENRVRDYGFDGLAITRIGSVVVYSGLQAKYYTNKQVCASDIGSFILKQNSLTRRNPLSKGYLYTTSKLQADLCGEFSDPTSNIRHVLHPWKHPDARSTQLVPSIQQECDKMLRADQVDALKQLEDKDGINAINTPCRWGKTIVAGHHTKRINPKLIVAIAPLLVSVENLQERLTCFLPGYSFLLVDSDTGGTTNVEVIKKFLASDGNLIIYSTFKSAIDILSDLLTEFEDTYILGDEIHNANAELCEFIQQFPRGLVMSATLPEEIVNTIDINHTVYIPFAQAIKDGIVVDYTLWLPHLTKTSDGTTSVDVEIPVEFSTYDSDLTAKAFYLATVMLKTGSRRCITYLGRQEDCDRFVEIVIQIFEIYHGLTVWTGKIDSTISKTKRKELLEAFQTGQDDVYHILTSVRILDEAVDIPRCDSVFITNVGEQSSDIRMMQRSQRSSTKDPKNPSKHNNIVLWADGWEKCVGALDLLREADPEFHKKVRIADCDYDKSGDSIRIENVSKELVDFVKWESMNCISLMHRNIQRINQIKVFREKYNTFPKCRGKKDDGYESILSTFIMTVRGNKKCGKLNKELEKKILEIIPDFVWSVFNENHNNKIQMIKEFYENYKEEPSQKGSRHNEKTLANYISSRRREYKLKLLKQDVKDKFSEELPWFVFEKIDNRNNEMLNTIEAFVKQNNRMPKHNNNTTESKLAGWISDRREAKKLGKLSTELEIDINNRFGSSWSWDFIESTFDNNILELKQFYETHGESPKKNGGRKNENKLNGCIRTWREKNKKGNLSTEHKNKISEILPWLNWDPLYHQNLEKIQAIKQFVDKYKELPKSKGNRDDGNEAILATYLIKCRKNYKDNKLDKEYIDLINKEWIGFQWNPSDENHASNICLIEIFYKEHKRFPTRVESDLGRYLTRIRSLKKEDNLPEDIINLIKEKLPTFSWDPKTEERLSLLQKIVEFHFKYNDEPRVNGKREDYEHQLGSYLSQRRVDKNKGELNEEIENQISKILPWFKWETKYKHTLPIVRKVKEKEKTDDYKLMSKTQLIEQCKTNNIHGYTHKTKGELIELLETPRNLIVNL